MSIIKHLFVQNYGAFVSKHQGNLSSTRIKRYWKRLNL
jgi:hypothetical protein